MDGNGRICRFLMNAMLASGGFSWTIIPVERRKEYIEALDAVELLGKLIHQYFGVELLCVFTS